MASGTRSFDNLDDQNVDWSLGLSFFGDFDPNISFLDDSALLPGFTPDWADCSGENPHPHFSPKHHENSLTSHEASSDEGEARITGTSRNTQAPRKRGRPRKVQHASPSTTSAAVTNTPNQSRQPVSSNIDRMLDDTPYIYDDTDTGLSASPLHSVAQNTSTSTNTDEAARKAQLQPSLSTSGGSATLSSRSSRCVARRTVVHLSGGDNDSADYLPGRVKSSVTGRKKAPEEARSVLMDWINDNKGKTHNVSTCITMCYTCTTELYTP